MREIILPHEESLDHDQFRRLPVPQLERVLAAHRQGERQRVESLDVILQSLDAWGQGLPEQDFVDDLVVRAKRSVTVVDPTDVEEAAAELVALLAWARQLDAGAIAAGAVTGMISEERAH